MQILADGLISGFSIALLATSFSVVYLPTRIFHLAIGGVYAAAPYVAWSCMRADIPWPAAIGAALVAGAVFSILCEALNHSPLDRRKASPGVHMVASLGVFIALSHSLVLIWGSESRSLRAGLDESFRIGAVALTRAQVLTAVVSFILITVFCAWLKFSGLGLRVRALADNPVEFALRGFDPVRLRLLAFGLAGMLASVAGLLAGFDLGFDPYAGLNALLLAVVAVIIGGRQSFWGPIIGGLLLGLLRFATAWFISASWQDGVTYALLAVFLFARPLGIAGRLARVEYGT